MTMTPLSWIIVGVAVVVIGIVILVANRRMGGMPPVVDDRPGMDLPDTPLTGEDLKGVRFAIVSRGYSMGQVDALLDRLSGQLDGTPFQPTDEHENWLGQAPADNQEAAPGAHNRPPSTFEQPLVAAVPTSDAPAVPVEAPAQVDVPVVPPVETPAPWGAPPAPVVEAPARMDPVPLLPYVPFPPAPPAEPEMAAAEPEMTEAPIISGPIFVGQRAADEPSHKSVDEPSNGVDESSNLMGMGAVVVEPWAVDAPVQPEVPLPPAPPVDESPVQPVELPLPPAPPVDELPVQPVELPLPPAPPVDEVAQPAARLAEEVPPPLAPPVEEVPPLEPPAMRADLPPAFPDAPVTFPDAPVTFPDVPVAFPDVPVTFPEVPVAFPTVPEVLDAPAARADTPAESEIPAPVSVPTPLAPEFETTGDIRAPSSPPQPPQPPQPPMAPPSPAAPDAPVPENPFGSPDGGTTDQPAGRRQAY